MGRKKRKKPQYDQFSTLQPMALRSEVEGLARRLYELACCSSRNLWEEIKHPDNLKKNAELNQKFLAACHEGMWEAQKTIIILIQANKGLTPSHQVLFRGIADSIAWQLIGQQLCYARRLFKEHLQPDPRHSNLKSVVIAAENSINDNPGSMALISDLTSFIQVGDLLTMTSTGRLGIVEVKEGEKNRAIGEFMEFFLKHGCERSLYYFVQQEGKNSVNQLGRMLRQTGRMAHVTEVMSKGVSVDPDSKYKIKIPEDYVFMGSWNDELNRVLAESETKGWAISVIDECLFLGCYSEESMKRVGHVVFNGWFDSCGGTPKCPRSLLIDGMRHPLAMPIFSLNIPSESKFDILFGRKQVCIGINVESLLDQCRKVGLQVRFATNKEATRLDQTGNHPYRHKNKAVYIGNGGAEMALMDGIFLRAMFHMQRPIHIIKSFLDNQETSHTSDYEGC